MQFSKKNKKSSLMWSSQPSLSWHALKNELGFIGEGMFGFMLARCHGLMVLYSPY
jgi:hypothetical protein